MLKGYHRHAASIASFMLHGHEWGVIVQSRWKSHLGNMTSPRPAVCLQNAFEEFRHKLQQPSWQLVRRKTAERAVNVSAMP